MIYTILPINNEFYKYSYPEYSYLYYRDYRINLLTGIREHYQIVNWYNQIQKIKLNSLVTERVIHLFYELGGEFLNLPLLDKDTPLAIDLSYSKCEKILKKEPLHKIDIKNEKGIEYTNYKKKYLKGREELLKGNCYQFNLTCNFSANFDNTDNPEDFIWRLWRNKKNIGAYAHATYIPFLKKLYLSNSPECLFQISKVKKDYELISMPIKGSLKCSSIENILEVEEEFKHCKKNKAELNMITDLLRNDLCGIEKPIAKVLIKNRSLYVPGLLHQYSLINVSLSWDVNLLSILKALFPGGSITGAPKYNVTKILTDLEKCSRGFYCGSSIVLDKNIMASSINIRTAVIDFNSKTLNYGAGGGITIESNCAEEYEEMFLKYKSFIELIK